MAWALQHRLNSGGAGAYLFRSMWHPPGSGMEPMFPALAGRSFTTETPWKPSFGFCFVLFLQVRSGFIQKETHFTECGPSQRAGLQVGGGRRQMLQSLLWFLNSTRVCVLIKNLFLQKNLQMRFGRHKWDGGHHPPAIFSWHSWSWTFSKYRKPDG